MEKCWLFLSFFPILLYLCKKIIKMIVSKGKIT